MKNPPVTASRAARELIAANRARKMRPADNNAPPQTVEAWLAQGGKIERLPDRASGLKKRDGLRFDHSNTRPPRPVHVNFSRLPK